MRSPEILYQLGVLRFLNNSVWSQTEIKINNHSVGDPINGLTRDYYKSVLNMQDNEVSIHLLYDFQVVGMLINFIIKDSNIKNSQLVSILVNAHTHIN